MNWLKRLFHIHRWFYYNRAGVGDFLDRKCACGAKEHWYGERSYYHLRYSSEWQTEKEHEAEMKEWRRLKDL